MNKDELFMMLQLAGGTFPTGGFSQSWGLETYVHQKLVTDEDSFREFLVASIGTTLAGLEGPVLCRAHDLAAAGDTAGLRELDRQVTAMKLTRESREGSLRMGKALLRIAAEMTDDALLSRYQEDRSGAGAAFPVAFALVSSRLGLSKESALGAYLFSAVSGMVQSGLKLIPLGNVQAQRLLLEMYPIMGEAADKALNTAPEDAFAFCPGLDIASMQHEALPTRLYMS